MEAKLKWWEQPWIGHAITILTVLATQLFAIYQIQRQVAAQAVAQREHELWKLKYDAYAQALDVVTRYFYSQEWTAGQVKHRFPAKAPTAEEYGQTYAKVRLLTDSPQLVGAFMAALGAEGKEDGNVVKHPLHPRDFQALVRAMRVDLGKGMDPTPDKDFALIDFSPPEAPKVDK